MLIQKERTISQKMDQQQKKLNYITRKRRSSWIPISIVFVCLLATSLPPPCQGFFFPKNFFRRAPPNGNPPPPPGPQQQQHPRVLSGGPPRGQPLGPDPLHGSGSEVQPSLRIVNRPPPSRNNAQQQPSGPPPGSGFHVPRELCLACERFPWMPVAGADKRPRVSQNTASQSQTQQHIQPFINSAQSSTPTKTIVINALGEAQGPVPIPPAPPSRRPFAIQFDGGSQSGNQINYQAPKSQSQQIVSQQQQQDSQQQVKQERPVTFQIFQAQTPNLQPTLLQPAPQPQPIGLNPPPLPQGAPQQAYNRPTILQPINFGGVPPQHSVNVQAHHPPPNPHTIGTIIASQQNKNNVLPEFQQVQPAKLVYQEHFSSQPPSAPPAPQNFKLPIIPHPSPPSNNDLNTQSNNYNTNNEPAARPPQIQPQQNFGPPPQEGNRPGLFLQMRPPAPLQFQNQPPRPSLNMRPPGVMVHYGQPVRVPNNIGPQRPSGQVHFPPPQAFLQMSPPPPFQNQPNNVVYGAPRPENNILDSGVRPQDERRPAPSGQVLNIQRPFHNNNQNFPPQNRPLNNNPVPVPIPVPENAQNFNIRPQQGNQFNVNERPRQNEPTFTQETGWEIIPSIQTDLTHLFSSENGKQPPQVGNELPVPVPIPVPQSHPPKNPVFIVTGGNQHTPQPQETQQGEQDIKVQDVTYHEERRNPVPSGSSPNTVTESRPNIISNQQHQEQVQSNTLTTSVNQQQQQNVEQERRPQPQVIRPRPFILGVPTGPARPIAFRPQPQQHFAPLHPSIMTALNHAQQTSLLTHQYLSQSNVGQPIRENTLYVSPAPLPTQAVFAQHVQSNGISGESVSNPLQETQSANHGIDPRIPRPGGDQSAVNCQTAHQWLIPITTHQKQQQQQEQQQQAQDLQQIEEEATSVDQSISSPSASGPEGDDQSENDNVKDTNENSPSPTAPEPTAFSPPEPTSSTLELSTAQSPGIRGSINVEDNGNKGSYLIYYPRPVSKSPVYWVQPSRTLSQGVVRLSPQLSQVSPSVQSTVVTWSRPRVVVANQFRTDQQPVPTPTQETRAEESYEKEETSGSNEQQASGQAFDEQIPYGQKLGVSSDNKRGQTPYDIISVSGSDESTQNLDENESEDHSQDIETSGNDSSSDQDGGLELTSSGNDEATDGNTSNQDFNRGSSGEYFEEEKQQQQLQNEHNLQNVQDTTGYGQDTADDADDERDDFGLRPQTTFRKPISTTVIHSPGASSFQSLKLPNFKPHRVIVHDFTTHTGKAASTGPSGSAGESQGMLESSESQQAPFSEVAPNSWKIAYKNKAPKLVDENEEDVLGHQSPQLGHRPQGLSIQEVIASGPVSTADCLTTTHTGHALASLSSSTSPRTAADSQGPIKGRDIYLPAGSRFPGGRPSIFSAIRRPVSPLLLTTPISTTTTASTSTVGSSERVLGGSTRERYFGQNPSGFAASIAVPVYRRPAVYHNTRDSLGRDESIGSNSHSSDTVTYIKPQANIILSAEDIYKNSEASESSNKLVDEDGIIRSAINSVESSTPATSPVESETADSNDEVMSTERSSSYSVSVVDDVKVGSSGSSFNNEDERLSSVDSNDLQQVDGKSSKVNVVHVTSVPVVTDAEPVATTLESLTSTTTNPSPASTSTKIVKTVRVRQRMRSGSFNGPLRTRFHGPGRVRVVHRPANQEYIRHFPEFATHEGDKLAKEEEQEVKNALIELKKSVEKTH